MGFFRRSKKGNAIIDGLTIVVFIFAFALITIIGYKFYDSIHNEIIEDTELSAEAIAVTTDYHDSYTNLWDNLFIFFFALLVIFVLVSVYVLDTNPAFFVVSIILLIVVVIIGAFLANSFDDIAEDSEISDYAEEFPKTSWILSNLVQCIIGIVLGITLVLFAKQRT